MLCYYDDVNKDARALTLAQFIRERKNEAKKMDEIVCRQQEKVSNDSNTWEEGERERKRTNE